VRYTNVLEDELPGVAGPPTELVLLLARRHTIGIRLDDKHRHPAVIGLGVGHGSDDERARHAGVGDKDLSPV
jgi:hypothetical protein